MKKWWIIALIICALIAIIVALGIYIYYINYTTEKNTIKSKELADDTKKIETNEEILATSSKETEMVTSNIKSKTKQYILKDHDGVIGIFEINSKNEEILVKDTQIQTKYLPEIDLIKLKNGIIINSEEELSSTLEDFE